MIKPDNGNISGSDAHPQWETKHTHNQEKLCTGLFIVFYCISKKAISTYSVKNHLLKINFFGNAFFINGKHAIMCKFTEAF